MSDLQKATVDTFDPDRVAAFLMKNDWAGCWKYLGDILSYLSPVRNVSGNMYLEDSMNDDKRREYVVKFGGMLGELIEALLADPASRLPDKSFFFLIDYHEVFHSLLYLNGKDDTDSLLEEIFDLEKPLDENQQKKLLMLLSLKTKKDIVHILKGVESKYRVRAISSYSSCLKIVDEDIYNNKVALYTLGKELEKSYSDIESLISAHVAYFQCSYLDIPNKHEIKTYINKASQRFLQGLSKKFKKIKSFPQALSDKIKVDPDKPRLLVIMELMTSNHAMTRIWGPWIRSLESEFNIMILVDKRKTDQGVLLNYPNTVVIENIGGVVTHCHDFSPDVLVFPSVGMIFFGIMASNMRLAPLQIMGLGHPATSMSDDIDFVYGPRHMYDERAFPKDKYLGDDIPMKFSAMMKKSEYRTLRENRKKPDADEPVVVSIVGTVQKMSAPFINLLKEIEEESPYEIVFSFHMGSFGVDSLALKKYFEEKFKKIRFYGWQHYTDYLKAINECDIVLNSFPFGNTNTVIDTLLLGKPCIGLDGVEPAAKTEAYVLERLGLQDKFVAKDKEDYKQKFHSYIGRIKGGDSEFFDPDEVFDKLFVEHDENHKDHDFGKSIKWVYDHQRELKNSPKKYFLIGEDVAK